MVRRTLPLFFLPLATLLACTDGSNNDGSESSADSEASSSSTSSTETFGTSSTQSSSSGDSATGASSTSASASSTSDTTSSGGETEATTSELTDGSSTGDATTTGCVPSEEICNDIDDDCNGVIDDVDEGMDGICDCLEIVILGKKGQNPSSEFEAWLEAQGTKVDRVHTTPNEPLTAETLATYDIVLLDWLQRAYSPDEAAVLEGFITEGGGMMSLTGFTNSQVNADVTNSLIGALGLTYNTSKGWFSGPITAFAPHPITTGLTSISFFGGLFVTATDDGVGTNETIMTLPQGPVGVAQERIEGRAFIFGDEWVEFDSEWKNVPEIKQFWVQTLRWLGPQSSCIVPG